MIIAWLPVHVAPALGVGGQDDAEAIARYIQEYIDQKSVIESWDWQIDALSGHWNYNHPPQHLLLLATRQRFIAQVPFDLKKDYDLLQADPDYLLTGPFSDSTEICTTRRLLPINLRKLSSTDLISYGQETGALPVGSLQLMRGCERSTEQHSVRHPHRLSGDDGIAVLSRDVYRQGYAESGGVPRIYDFWLLFKLAPKNPACKSRSDRGTFHIRYYQTDGHHPWHTSRNHRPRSS